MYWVSEMNGNAYTRLLIIPLLLLISSYAIDYCNTTNTTYNMVSNIDDSQYLNFPLAVEIQAVDGGGNPVADTECQITVYANQGKVIDFIQAIHPEKVCAQLDNGFFGLFKNDKLNQDILNGRLVTNAQGFARYPIDLGDRYQADNTYTIRVDCGSSCTKQTFTVLSGTTPYFFYNIPLFIKDNPMLLVVLGVMFLITMLILSSVLGAAFGW